MTTLFPGETITLGSPPVVGDELQVNDMPVRVARVQGITCDLVVEGGWFGWRVVWKVES